MEFNNFTKKLKHNYSLRIFIGVANDKAIVKNKLLKIKEEEELFWQKNLIDLSIRFAIRGDDGKLIKEKRILPLFSNPVILKKISDIKKYKNFSSIIPQKKLMYRVVKINKKLNNLVKPIHFYSLTLNKFKGNKLDFILFLRDSLYLNLKSRLSNISYKITLIKLIYSIFNSMQMKNKDNLNSKSLLIGNSVNNNLDQKYKSSSVDNALNIFSINLIKKENGLLTLPLKKDQSQYQDQEKLFTRFLDDILKLLNNNYNLKWNKDIKNKYNFSKYKSNEKRRDVSNNLFNIFQLIPSFKEIQNNHILKKPSNDEIKYLLIKLNTSIKKIESIINIIKINKEIIKYDESIAEIWRNKIVNTIKELKNDKTKVDTKEISNYLQSNNNNNKNLYMQILQNNYNNDYLGQSQGIDKQIKKENLITIDNTIKRIANQFKEIDFLNKFNNSNNTLKERGIFIKQFDREKDSFYSNSNPVNLLYFNDNKNKPMINQYLKSMSMFNLTRNGSFMFFTNIIGYKFYNKNFKPFFNYTGTAKYSNIYKLIYSTFLKMNCLISKPVFIIKSNKIIIQLFYYILLPGPERFKDKFIYNNDKQYIYGPYGKEFERWSEKYRDMLVEKNEKKKNKKFKKRIKLVIKKFHKLAKINLYKLYKTRFKKLCIILNNFFGKAVELELIRLQYPYKDSNILAKLLELVINEIKFRAITRKLIKGLVLKKIKNNYRLKNKTNLIPAFISGLTIKVAGRIMTYKIIPRKTVKIFSRGASSVGKINYKNFSRATAKNKRGAFSISITAGHNFSK